MKKLLFSFQNNQTEISAVLLFVLSMGLIVYLSPREAQFKYEFQKGKPWMHENLVAPFDFPIYKSPEELAAEKRKIRAQKSLYLERRPAPQKEALSRWREKELISPSSLPPALANLDSLSLKARVAQVRDSVAEMLSQLYKRGILQAPREGLSDEYGEVLLREGGSSRPTELNRYYSLQAASEQLRLQIPGRDAEERKYWLNKALAELHHNIFFDLENTERALAQELQQVLPTRGVVQKGELIAGKGNLIDDERYVKLFSLKSAYEGSLFGGRSFIYILLGQILLVSLLLLLLYLYLWQFQRAILEEISRLTFILLNLFIMVALAHLLLRLNQHYLYALPLAILPMVLRSFFDLRLALFVHVIAMLIIGFQAPNSFEFFFLQFLAGFFAIFQVQNLYKRRELFITAGKITLAYSFGYISLAIVQEANLDSINYQRFSLFAVNGLLTLISFPLIYFQERLFGLTSEISLLELSDTNNELLRNLAQEAPGSFQHSLQVANLCEAGVLAIGGNALLARTGALYHDIGKIQSPMYFIENQSTGINPHDELSFEESAEIIIGHVKHGIRLAKKHMLPDVIIDFIRTHHGTSTVMYFYRQYIKDFPEEKNALTKFSYPGPKPFSKETAVLMMADTVEAASRSLSQPDHDKLDQLVEKLIDQLVDSGQFENAPISLKEITQVKSIFKKMLMNIYHVRIKYPD